MELINADEVEQRLGELAELAQITEEWLEQLKAGMSVLEQWLRVVEFRLMEGNYEN